MRPMARRMFTSLTLGPATLRCAKLAGKIFPIGLLGPPVIEDNAAMLVGATACGFFAGAADSPTTTTPAFDVIGTPTIPEPTT